MGRGSDPEPVTAKRLRRAVLGLLIVVFSGLSLAAPPGCAADPAKAAEAAAREWLRQVDAGQYVAAWNESAKLFRARIDARDWQQAAAGARQPLGAVRRRNLASARQRDSLPGAPDGDYIVLRFATAFANKAAAVETVTTVLDSGDWRVAGYIIR